MSHFCYGFYFAAIMPTKITADLIQDHGLWFAYFPSSRPKLNLNPVNLAKIAKICLNHRYFVYMYYAPIDTLCSICGHYIRGPMSETTDYTIVESKRKRRLLFHADVLE